MWLLLETNCHLFFLPLSLLLSFVNKYEANPSSEAQPRPKQFNFLSTSAPGHPEWSWTIKCLGKVNKYGCDVLVFSHGTTDVTPITPNTLHVLDSEFEQEYYKTEQISAQTISCTEELSVYVFFCSTDLTFTYGSVTKKPSTPQDVGLQAGPIGALLRRAPWHRQLFPVPALAAHGHAPAPSVPALCHPSAKGLCSG